MFLRQILTYQKKTLEQALPKILEQAHPYGVSRRL